MNSIFQYLAPAGPCGYLPDQSWRLEYEVFSALSAEEYMGRLLQGWRRFGNTLFRPRCPACNACQSLRVLVDRFRPDRSQRRARQANQGTELRIGRPSITRAKLELYDKYHAHQARERGWPIHDVQDSMAYANSFVDNPFTTEEWRYYVRDQLVGVGYVDVLPGGLSAIYFFYDPAYRQRSLGTWNILCLVDQAAAYHRPYLYLGYYVAGSRSMVYKARFVPNEVLGPDGQWREFRSL